MKFHLCLICLCGMVAGCSGPIPNLYSPQALGENPKTIYVVSHGWHTGIVVNRNDVSDRLALLQEDFPTTTLFEIGWGDAGFYQTPEITTKLVLQALFWPSDSVMHIVALPTHPKRYFPRSEVIEVKLSEEGFQKMIEFIMASFARDAHHQIIKMQKGLYGNSRFYQGQGTYHLFNTCNSWTAEAIRASGFPISTVYALTAGNVLFQLEREVGNDN